ncbi:MAG: WYL domain-containing protein [Actinobacteria bacterium]|jgi:proteasome accessory factor C|nr:WYL domain-containing protein [Actinomycetota bacterium]
MSAVRPDTTAAGRLQRLLALVPWLRTHDGTTVVAAAEHFGVSVDTLVEDLNLLIVSGLPGYGPDQLVDIDFFDDEGEITVSNPITVIEPQTLARPLRFSPDEAAALLVALRLLATVPGPHDRGAIASASAKLEKAAGDAVRAAEGLAVLVDAGAAPAVRDAVESALASGRQLHIVYVGALDDRTERDVDPLRIVSLDGRVYLEAWCHRAEAMRTFRLDRIESAEVLAAPVAVPSDAVPLDLQRGVLRPEGAPVTLLLAPQVRWIAEEHPVDAVEEAGDGRLRVVLPLADERWLVRLLLRHGSAIEVLDRPDLAERARADALAALAAYSAG